MTADQKMAAARLFLTIVIGFAALAALDQQHLSMPCLVLAGAAILLALISTREDDSVIYPEPRVVSADDGGTGGSQTKARAPQPLSRRGIAFVGFSLLFAGWAVANALLPTELEYLDRYIAIVVAGTVWGLLEIRRGEQLRRLSGLKTPSIAPDTHTSQDEDC